EETLMNKQLFWAAVAMLILTGLAEAQEPEPVFDEKKACPPADECDGNCNFDWTPYYEPALFMVRAGRSPRPRFSVTSGRKVG
ncbi:MAG: hypothetical protein ACREUP_12285, partial [Burkholderiales bacterium]